MPSVIVFPTDEWKHFLSLKYVEWKYQVWNWYVSWSP